MKILTSNQDHHLDRQRPQATKGRDPKHLRDEQDPGYRPIPDRPITRCTAARTTTWILQAADVSETTHIVENNDDGLHLHADQFMNV